MLGAIEENESAIAKYLVDEKAKTFNFRADFFHDIKNDPLGKTQQKVEKKRDRSPIAADLKAQLARRKR